MKGKLLVLALVAPCVAACSLPTNVAIKRVDSLRAEQDACLKNNLSQFDDHGADAKKIGRFVAMSCTTQTDKLVQYAVPNASRREYQAFQDDAAARATGYVRSSRGEGSVPAAYQPPASGAPQAL